MKKIKSILFVLAFVLLLVSLSQALTVSYGGNDGSASLQFNNVGRDTSINAIGQISKSGTSTSYNIGSKTPKSGTLPTYSLTFTSQDGKHRVTDQLISATGYPIAVWGTASTGYDYASVYKDFSMRNGYLKAYQYAWAASTGTDSQIIELQGTGSGSYSAVSDMKGASAGYGPSEAKVDFCLKDFQGNLKYNQPETVSTNGVLSKATLTNAVLRKTKTEYPFWAFSKACNPNTFERQNGATYHLDSQIRLYGYVDSANVESFANYLDYNAYSFAGWNSPGSGSLVEKSYGTNAPSVVYNAQTSAQMVTDSNNANVKTWTKQPSGLVSSGLWFKADPIISSGDITTLDIKADSNIQKGMNNYDSVIDTKSLVEKGIEASTWHYDGANKVWDPLKNQYLMGKYYTTIPVSWKFKLTDKYGYSASHTLNSKAGDLDNNGKTVLKEVVDTINMWNRGEVTQEYVNAAIKNWKNGG